MHFGGRYLKRAIAALLMSASLQLPAALAAATDGVSDGLLGSPGAASVSSAEAASPAVASLPAEAVAAKDDNFKSEYKELSRQILLDGIALERFSLNYRLEASRQSNLKYLRYGLTQQAGASGGLAFESIAVREFRKARRRPLQLNTQAISRGFKAFEVTGIIAGAGSAFELGANTVRYIRSCHQGFDSKAAAKYVIERSKHLDELMARHQALVAAHKEHPAYRAALADEAMMLALRDSVLSEFSKFHTDVRAYRTYENLFYGLNIATNVTGVISGYHGNKGLHNPKFNGSSSVLLIVSGGLTALSPLISTGAGIWAGKAAKDSFFGKLGYEPKFDPKELKARQEALQTALAGYSPDEHQIPAILTREAIYKQSQVGFADQLRAENRVFRMLANTAFQSDLLAPNIGGTLVTQGVLGTVGYYNYRKRPAKALNLAYKGAAAGIVGTGIAVGATALGIIADNAFYYHLYKNKKLPKQLIEKRLEQLSEFEQSVRAM